MGQNAQGRVANVHRQGMMQKYDKTEVLKCSKKRDPISHKGVYRSESQGAFIPAKYMVIAGGQENLTRNLSEELKVATSPENTDGSHIKVIIGEKQWPASTQILGIL